MENNLKMLHLQWLPWWRKLHDMLCSLSKSVLGYISRWHINRDARPFGEESFLTFYEFLNITHIY